MIKKFEFIFMLVTMVSIQSILWADEVILITDEEELEQVIGQLTDDQEIIFAEGEYHIDESISLEYRDNITIRGEENTEVQITIEDVGLPVFSITDCDHIHFSNLNLAHQVVQDSSCGAPVMKIRDSQWIEISDMDLYGCGTAGTEIRNSQNIVIKENHFHSNSFAGISLSNVQGIDIHNNEIEMNHYSLYIGDDVSDLKMWDNRIHNNVDTDE